MVKIAINGFGRIGRPTVRRIIEKHPDIEIIAINDLTDSKTLAFLLKHDSIYREFGQEVSFTSNSLLIGSGKKQKEIKIFTEKEPENLPWKKLGVDIVLECTGNFTNFEGANKHIKAGARMVIMSAPAKDTVIPTYVLGVNAQNFDPQKDNIIDMASCTTNCLAPIAKVLNDKFKIITGFMTTTHSYTNDQKILDLPHKDLRRARAAALNIIPTTTGAAKAIGKAIPELEGKLDGIAFRVPTPAVSVLDLVVRVAKPASVEDVNKALERASKSKEMKGILKFELEPLVSADFIGDSHSAIVDGLSTMVKNDLVKVIGWYDNEYGYSCRLAEMAEYCGKKI